MEVHLKVEVLFEKIAGDEYEVFRDEFIGTIRQVEEWIMVTAKKEFYVCYAITSVVIFDQGELVRFKNEDNQLLQLWGKLRRRRD